MKRGKWFYGMSLTINASGSFGIDPEVASGGQIDGGLALSALRLAFIQGTVKHSTGSAVRSAVRHHKGITTAAIFTSRGDFWVDS